MMLEIETEAAKILLKILLSCQCPITSEMEKEITNYFLSQQDKASLNFQKMIDITGGLNANTVVRRLRDCCFYYKNNLDDVLITKEDVYRHFCNASHWKINEDTLATFPSDANMLITDMPAWLVGHMLLPVKLKQESNSVYAEYAGLGFRLQLYNIFTPSDINIEENTLYSIHFASVISEITSAQSKMISQQLENNAQFIEFRNKTKSIDYSNFQRYGDYRKFCENRYCKYFT